MLIPSVSSAMGRRRASSGGAYTANAIYGSQPSSDFINRSGGISGASDNKLLLLSHWVKCDTKSSNGRIINQGGDIYILHKVLTGTQNFQFLIYNTSGIVINCYWSSTSLSTDTWYHFLFSVDMSDSGKRFLYINDTDYTSSITWAIYNNVNFEWSDTSGTISIGGNPGQIYHTFYGCLSEFYMTNEYLDISVEANRRKFINDSGAPVDLGSDGSTPTGTQPLLYFNNPASTWYVNKGSGGSFAEEAGATITNCSDTPSS